MREDIRKIIASIETKHPDDPAIIKELDRVTNILSQSEADTISILNALDEKSISWISSSFEELSYKFRSQNFLSCLSTLVYKYPDIVFLKEDVNDAKKVRE